MGTDALFHKRKARRTKDLARRKASRAPYAKVLIVCEGRKTEPNYFTGLRDDYRLNSANVEITEEGDSTPEGVLALARARYQQEQTAGDPFDTVFCVFDKDDHAGYSRALARLSSIRPRGVFRDDRFGTRFRVLVAVALRIQYQAISDATGQNRGGTGVGRSEKALSSIPERRQGHIPRLAGKVGDSKTTCSEIAEGRREEQYRQSLHQGAPTGVLLAED